MTTPPGHRRRRETPAGARPRRHRPPQGDQPQVRRRLPALESTGTTPAQKGPACHSSRQRTPQPRRPGKQNRALSNPHLTSRGALTALRARSPAPLFHRPGPHSTRPPPQQAPPSRRRCSGAVRGRTRTSETSELLGPPPAAAHREQQVPRAPLPRPAAPREGRQELTSLTPRQTTNPAACPRHAARRSPPTKLRGVRAPPARSAGSAAHRPHGRLPVPTLRVAKLPLLHAQCECDREPAAAISSLRRSRRRHAAGTSHSAAQQADAAPPQVPASAEPAGTAAIMRAPS